MKLFKKLMSAMLAGVLAVGMLAGCSGGSVNGPVPTSPRPEDPAVQAVYEVIEQKTAKMNFVSAPAYSKEASALAEAYLNGGDKTKAFNELKAALAQQGLLTIARRPFAPPDVAGAFLVVAATDRREVNRQVGQLARRQGDFVSVADCAQ